jgi:hypothetical protein
MIDAEVLKTMRSNLEADRQRIVKLAVSAEIRGQPTIANAGQESLLRDAFAFCSLVPSGNACAKASGADLVDLLPVSARVREPVCAMIDAPWVASAEIQRRNCFTRSLFTR